MNQETLAQLVTYAQAGDLQSLEQLLLWAHTPVSFLCKKLLTDNQIAHNQTREVLQAIWQKLPSLQSPALFEKWVIRLTTAWCIQFQKKNTWIDDEEAQQAELPILGETLDNAQTIDAVQKMVDMLPLQPRTCITLLCCCEMNSSAIAQLTGYSVEDIHQNMSIAQNFILEQLQKYQDLNTEFYPINSLTEVLQSGMQVGNREKAIAMVYGILGKKIPTPPDPNRTKKMLLIVGIVALVLLNLVLGVLILLVKNKNTFALEEYAAASAFVSTVAQSREEIFAFPENV